MTRFSSDILLPFPNSNDLNSRDFSAILKLDRHKTTFQSGNQVHKSQSKQETCVISFYVFTLPFFTFSKECLYEMKKIC